jgi:solute carrier family 35 protein C2
MCKSSNLAFVLFFAFLFKLEKLRLSLIGIITLITIGVIMMVAAETQFVLVGAVQVLTASAMGGLRWALTQMLLHKSQMGMDNPIATIFWLSPLMSFFMILSSIFLEDWRAMFGGQFFRDYSSALKSIALMIAPGFIAFLMNLSEFA